MASPPKHEEKSVGRQGWHAEQLDPSKFVCQIVLQLAQFQTTSSVQMRVAMAGGQVLGWRLLSCPFNG